MCVRWRLLYLLVWKRSQFAMVDSNELKIIATKCPAKDYKAKNLLNRVLPAVWCTLLFVCLLTNAFNPAKWKTEVMWQQCNYPPLEFPTSWTAVSLSRFHHHLWLFAKCIEMRKQFKSISIKRKLIFKRWTQLLAEKRCSFSIWLQLPFGHGHRWWRKYQTTNMFQCHFGFPLSLQ